MSGVGHIPAAGSCPVMNLTFYEERSVVIHQGMSSVDKEQATTSVFIPSFCREEEEQRAQRMRWRIGEDVPPKMNALHSFPRFVQERERIFLEEFPWSGRIMKSVIIHGQKTMHWHIVFLFTIYTLRLLIVLLAIHLQIMLINYIV